MALLTTLQQINIEKVCQYLNAEEISKGSLFGAIKSPTSPIILYMERKAVEYYYNIDHNESTLRLTGDYLYSLCKKNQRAAYIINAGGGGSISPVVPTPGAPSPYDFEAASNTFMVPGDIVKFFPSTWIGWNLQFARGSILQSITVPDVGNYFSWDITKAKLTLLSNNIFGPAPDPSIQADERIQFWPVGGTGSGGSTTTAIVSPIKITGADFANATDWNGQNAGGVTVASSYTLQVFFNDIPRFLDEGVEWSRTATGFQILLSGLPGFDATTTNLNSIFYIYMSA